MEKPSWESGELFGIDTDVSERQLDRVKSLRRSREIRKAPGFHSNDEDMGEFAARSTSLDLVRRFREGRKRDLVGKLLRQAITTHYSIYPSFGKSVFFEFQFENPY